MWREASQLSCEDSTSTVLLVVQFSRMYRKDGAQASTRCRVYYGVGYSSTRTPYNVWLPNLRCWRQSDGELCIYPGQARRLRRESIEDSWISQSRRIDAECTRTVHTRVWSRLPLHRRGRQLLQLGHHGKRGFHTRLRTVTLFTDPVVAFFPSQRRHQKLTTALPLILLTSFHALPQILQNKRRSRFPV